MITQIKPANWQKRDELWQRRHFLLSSFVRNNITITSRVYEFIDDLIKNNYQPPLDSLTSVDTELKNLYEEYA
jgi:hypothetical protein